MTLEEMEALEASSPAEGEEETPMIGETPNEGEPSDADKGESTPPESAPEGEGSKPEEKPEGEKEETTKDDAADKHAAEISELRQLLRESRREMDSLKSQLTKTGKKVDEAIPGNAEEGEEGSGDPGENDILMQAREIQLDTCLEVMRLNPKYEDVDEVVSQEHFDDAVEMIAKGYAEEKGVRNFRDVLPQVEEWAWKQKNPYLFMYKYIKSNHPKYQETTKTPTDTASPQKKEKPTKPADAPPSLADKPGGSSSSEAGWTAAKIDDLPEEQLSTVPKDIYLLYMQGKLS